MTTKDDVQKLQAQLEEMREQLSQLSESAGKDVSEQTRAYAEKAVATTKETGKKMHKYAKENPWQVAAVAAILGLAVGSAMTPRKDKSDKK